MSRSQSRKYWETVERSRRGGRLKQSAAVKGRRIVLPNERGGAGTGEVLAVTLIAGRNLAGLRAIALVAADVTTAEWVRATAQFDFRIHDNVPRR